MSQKELLSAFQSGLSQSFSLVEKMSADQRQAAALALQGFLQKTPIADVSSSKSKAKGAEVARKSVTKSPRHDKDSGIVDGKNYRLSKRGRPSNRELETFTDFKKTPNTLHSDNNEEESPSTVAESKKSARMKQFTGPDSNPAKGSACDVCGRYFSQRGNMQRHRMRHTGERPWQCEKCGAGFIEKKSLMIHCERKHSDKSAESPIHCEVCGVLFRSKLHAAKHSCVKKETVSADDAKTSNVKTSFTVAIKRKYCHINDKQEQAENKSTQLDADDENNVVQSLPRQNEIQPEDDIAEIEKHYIVESEEGSRILGDAFFFENGDGNDIRVECVVAKENEEEEDSDDIDGPRIIMKQDIASDDDNVDNASDLSDNEDNRYIARKIMSAIAKEQIVSRANKTTTTSLGTVIHSTLVTQNEPNATSTEDCDTAQRSLKSFNSNNPKKVTTELDTAPKLEQRNAKSQSIFVQTGEKKLLEFPVPCKSSSSWKCPQCNQVAKNFHSLWTHLKSHAESGGSLQCRFCDMTLASLPNLQRHYLATHDTSPFQCCRCRKNCRTYLSYEQHLRDCMDEITVKSDSLQCPFCKKQYRSLVTLRAHIDGKHSEKRYKCNYCSRAFSFPSNLLRHTKLHTGDRPHQCEHCGKGFIERKCLITHLMRKHSGAAESEGVHCEICGKGFGSQSLLNVHLLVHSPHRSFSCSLCSKTFSLKANMMRHELTHSGAKPYKCPECGKAFTEKRSVTVHMRQHTGERPFKCPHCPKSFTQSGNLDAHLPVHTGIRKFLCTLCGATFLRRTHHAQHMRKHQGPPDINCAHCSAAFYRQTDLRRHMLTHSQQRIHQCDVCQRMFTRASYLRDHANTHTGAKPYSCSVCAAQFAESATLYKHARLHHIDPVGEETADGNDEDNEEDLSNLISVATQLDATQLDPASTHTPQIVYLEQPLDLLTGTEPETEGGTEVETDASMDIPATATEHSQQVSTEEPRILPSVLDVPVTEGSVEVHAEDYSIQIPTIEEVSAMETSMEFPAIEPAMAFTEVSELETGDHVFEIDGLEDSSQVAFQQLPDQSGYYLIINRAT